jgi:hypothetical protein
MNHYFIAPMFAIPALSWELLELFQTNFKIAKPDQENRVHGQNRSCPTGEGQD